MRTPVDAPSERDDTAGPAPPAGAQVVVGVEEKRRVRHFEGLPWWPQQSLRLGQPQRSCPTRLGLGRVRLGLRAWFCDRLRCPLLRWVLWRPVFRLRGRLRHAPPLGDQPLGSSRLAVDSRLLLGADQRRDRRSHHLSRDALRVGGRPGIVKGDAASSKKDCPFRRPLRVEQSTQRKSSSGSACGRPSPTWQLMFHGPELINPDLAGTVIVRKLEKAGQNPALCQFRG